MKSPLNKGGNRKELKSSSFLQKHAQGDGGPTRPLHRVERALRERFRFACAEHSHGYDHLASNLFTELQGSWALHPVLISDGELVQRSYA